MISQSVLFVILLAIGEALLTWLCSCHQALLALLRSCSDASSNSNATPKPLLTCFLNCCEALLNLLRRCRDASPRWSTSREEQPDVESAGSAGTEFMVVEFNAWECAGSDILWAAVTTKIFERVRSLNFGFICSSACP